MRGKIRTLLEPLPKPSGTIRGLVSGVLVAFTRGGPGNTLATKQRKSAKLVFHVALFKRVRPQEEREERQLATLQGSIELRDTEERAVFVLPSIDAFVHEPIQEPEPSPEPSGETVPERLVLTLAFARNHYEGPDNLKLEIPGALMAGFRHLELFVDLEIDGTLESRGITNGVLDRPLTFRPLDIFPKVCLDTPVADPAEHNLAFRIKMPEQGMQVISFQVGGRRLEEGEEFVQHGDVVFFRPKSKPSDGISGILATSDERTFEFKLKVAQTIREKVECLGAQLENGIALANTAAERAREAGKTDAESNAVRDDLLNQILHRERRLLTSIEGTLQSDKEHAEFYSRMMALPPVRAPEAS